MIGYIAFLIEQILQNLSVSEVWNRKRGDRIPLSRLREICYAAEDDATEPMLEKQLDYMARWIQEEGNGGTHQGQDQDRDVMHFCDLVDCFSTKVLTKAGTEIVYRYKFLEEWHRATIHMGEDLFVTCACAFRDSQNQGKREDFSWKWVLGHDNYEVNRILDRGISDNHYHLRASNPYFDLSWSSLMNSVADKQTINFLKDINTHPRNIRKQYAGQADAESFRVMHLKAALIRLYLYSELTGQLIALRDYKASVVWLLECIFDIECPHNLMGQEAIPETSETVAAYLEQMCGDTEKIRKSCPGFYFFFWEKCADIPIDILPDRTEMFSKRNLDVICGYVEKKYVPFSLADCSLFFTGRHYECFCEEWRRQTRQTVERWLSDDMAVLAARSSIQRAIDMLHEGVASDCKDYMFNGAGLLWAGEQGRSALHGERWFLYKMFLRRYDRKSEDFRRSEKLYRYFLMYLIIKNRFRRELSYSNGKIGFANFAAYQSRKNWFTTSFSEAERTKSAVYEAFHREKLRSLELRITPLNSWKENCRQIQMYDSAIRELKDAAPCENQFYYVFHFGKRQDDEKGKKSSLFLCRHRKYRMELRQMADAIIYMREHSRETACRLRGVDACSSEDGCRPEVFASAFRVLKNHVVPYRQGEKQPSQLRLSYHVGEDNQDVLDGVRAVDEAIFFLGMGSGDRLGHATMLGVDPLEWYNKRNCRVAIRQQDYLDNVVWLFGQIVRYKLPNWDNILEYLRKEYHVYFERIYRNALKGDGEYRDISEFDIHTYYAAWELRGDDPERYKRGNYEKRQRLSVWDDYGINSRVNGDVRMIRKVALLYYAYHYSDVVYREGSKPILVEIPFHMIKGIQAVQRRLMQHIAKLGISIETNPTSNVMISRLQGYEHHPILSFYNKGLVDRGEGEDDCAQIHVSINTDDAGVFSTSLRNEYSLMAKSLEQMRDKEGNFCYKKDRVYDWLNHIREMGNEQSFSENAL